MQIPVQGVWVWIRFYFSDLLPENADIASSWTTLAEGSFHRVSFESLSGVGRIAHRSTQLSSILLLVFSPSLSHHLSQAS